MAGEKKHRSENWAGWKKEMRQINQEQKMPD